MDELVKRAREAYQKVSLFPESKFGDEARAILKYDPSFMDLLAARNMVPILTDAIEALQAQIARLTAERDAAYERAAEVSESFDGFQIGAVTWPRRIAATIRAMKDGA